MEVGSSYTVPLYDRVKNQVYDDYQRVKRQQTIVLTVRSKRKRILALKEFRSKFLRFFFEIYSLTTFDFLNKEIKDKLLDFANEIKQINKLDKVNEVVLYSTLAIRTLGITKISYENNNDSF